MPKLILTYQNKVQENYLVPPGAEIFIGRDAANQIVIDHPSVSGRHAKVRQQGKGLVLTDLGSTNGTFVNDNWRTRIGSGSASTSSSWICTRRSHWMPPFKC